MKLSDSKLRSLLAQVIIFSVITAAAVMFVGGVIYLVESGDSRPGDRTFSGEPADLRHPVAIFQDALRGHDASVVQLGVLILLFNPWIRVGFSVIAFGVQRDRLYAGISLLVFVILSVSFFL